MNASLANMIKEHYGEEAAEIFRLNQLYLSPAERVGDNSPCATKQGGYTCQLNKHHNGRHIAHNLLGNIVHTWDW